VDVAAPEREGMNRGARHAGAFLLALSLAGCQRSLGPEIGVGTGNPYEPRPLAPEVEVARTPVLDAEAATREARARVEREPGSVRAHIEHVRTLTTLGRRAEAQAWYESRAARPDAREVDRVMAARLGARGSSSALRRVYAAAAQAEPRQPWWYLALADIEVSEARAWNRRRNEAAERGDADLERTAHEQARAAVFRAERDVERAREVAPPMAEMDLYEAHARALAGDLAPGARAREQGWRDAEGLFARAVAADEGLVEAWSGLGDVRYRLGDLGGSLHAHLMAARRAPADGTLRTGLGVVLFALDRHGDAAVQLRAAASLLPHDPDPLVRLGDVLAADERYEAALTAYAEALERDPDRAVEAWARRGAVLEFLGRRAEARLAYERYVEAGGTRKSAIERRIDRLLRGEGR